VDTIFLDQETFGMSEELHQATVRGARVVFISIAIVFIAVIAVLLATAS
jgi:hypothetical protein